MVRGIVLSVTGCRLSVASLLVVGLGCSKALMVARKSGSEQRPTNNQQPVTCNLQLPFNLGLKRFGFTRAIPFGQGRCCGAPGLKRADARDVVQADLAGFLSGFR
jgi:hypothetical protein